MILTACCLAGLPGCEPGEGPEQVPELIEEGYHVGFRAPDFTAQTLKGRPVSLGQQRGKIVMLNFWATWCLPCRVEMPWMQQLYDRFGGEDFEILAISGGEPEEVVHPFVDELGVKFPILLDRDFGIHKRYQVMAIPSTYLIDRDGVITHRFFGAVEWEQPEYQQLIAQLIRAR